LAPTTSQILSTTRFGLEKENHVANCLENSLDGLTSLALLLLESVESLASLGGLVGLKATSVDYTIALGAGEDGEGLSTNTLWRRNSIFDWALDDEIAEDGGVLDDVLDVLASITLMVFITSKVCGTSGEIVDVASSLQVLGDDMVKS
jgi:hypothetical protein